METMKRIYFFESMAGMSFLGFLTGMVGGASGMAAATSIAVICLILTSAFWALGKIVQHHYHTVLQNTGSSMETDTLTAIQQEITALRQMVASLATNQVAPAVKNTGSATVQQVSILLDSPSIPTYFFESMAGMSFLVFLTGMIGSAAGMASAGVLAVGALVLTSTFAALGQIVRHHERITHPATPDAGVIDALQADIASIRQTVTALSKTQSVSKVETAKATAKPETRRKTTDKASV